jgi:hypothetical protein
MKNPMPWVVVELSIAISTGRLFSMLLSFIEDGLFTLVFIETKRQSKVAIDDNKTATTTKHSAIIGDSRPFRCTMQQLLILYYNLLKARNLRLELSKIEKFFNLLLLE